LADTQAADNNGMFRVDWNMVQLCWHTQVPK